MDLSSKFYKIRWILLIITGLVFLLAAGASAQVDDYLLRGDQITFSQETGIVIFAGNAYFKAEDFVVKAERFELDTKNKVLKASAGVLIESEKDDIRGQSLEYNYGEETGSLYGAEGSLGEIYFSGSKLDIFSTSPLAGNFAEAEFTPCRRDDPHYHFKAKEIKINPDNTLSIYDIVPYIGDIPVFYLPYYSVTYDPEAAQGAGQFSETFPVPQLGYDTEKGITVEFSYPYQIGALNSGKIYYWKAGSDLERDEERIFSNQHQLTDNLSFKNKYYYLYDYDFEDEELDDEEEDFISSFEYRRSNYRVEAGYMADLMPEDTENKLFIDADYSFKNGLNTGLRKEYNLDTEKVDKTVYTADYQFQTGVKASFFQEYESQELLKEKYLLSHNQTAVNWRLLYQEGEDYNYYPYLDVSFPVFYSFKAALGTGRVENGGVELNKDRLNLNYNQSWQLPAGFSYHLSHSYRLDHYRSSYDQNYHYFVLNTGFRYQRQLTEKTALKSALFYKEDRTRGSSPLVDDREDEQRLLKPSLSIDLKGAYPDSAWSIETDAEYDLDIEDWEEINLRLRKKEDCFDLFIGYEFIEDSINFGLSI